jgi:hypothetical protein
VKRKPFVGNESEETDARTLEIGEKTLEIDGRMSEIAEKMFEMLDIREVR